MKKGTLNLLKNNKECKYCLKVFDEVTGSEFANHIRWCNKNPNLKNEFKPSEKFLEYLDNKFGKEIEITKNCDICKEEFTYKIREKSNEIRKVCGQKCSGKFAVKNGLTIETKQKIRTSINNYILKFGHTQNTTTKGRSLNKIKKEQKYCLNCGKEYYTNNLYFCSNKCKKENYIKNLNEYQKYRLDCQFKFSLKDYPNKFNFSLLKEYGIYKAKNHGNNPNGVSRDHMISIKYGWDNKIPSNIISHPANCSLIIHGENLKKNTKCSITIEELYKRINEW